MVINKRLNNLQPTEVFASYWKVAAERLSIYFKRLRGESPPWSSDEILQKFKFTNTFRVLDRVSQYLVREVIYRPEFPTELKEIVFRILFFKMFNSIPAWEVLVQTFGTPTWKGFNEKAYAKALGNAWNNGKGVAIWSLAYVQNQNYRSDLPKKHERYIALVKAMTIMKIRIRPRAWEGPRWASEQPLRITGLNGGHRRAGSPDKSISDNHGCEPGDQWLCPGAGALH
jgi:hypothetical protein